MLHTFAATYHVNRTKEAIAQDDFAQIAARITTDPRSLALLREVMKDAERKKDRGLRLRKARDERDWTQAQLMDRAGLGAHNHRKLQYWEAGTFSTSEENWEALAKALGVSFHWLFNGDEVVPPPADILAKLDAIDATLAKQTSQLAKLAANVSVQQPAQERRPSRPRRAAGGKAQRGG